MARIASVYDEAIFAKPEYLCNKVDMQEFETAQDMMDSNCLKVGYAHTLGFYEVGDGGEAYYRVVANPTGDEPNGMDVLKCRRCVAELLLQKIIMPEQFGGKGNGVFDNSEIFNRITNVLTENDTGEQYGNTFIVSGNGNSVYGITEITINEFSHLKDICFKAVTKTNRMITIIHLGIDGATNSGNYLERVSVNGNYKANTGIYIEYSRSYTLNQCYIADCLEYGIYSNNGNVEIIDSFIYNEAPSETLGSTGLYIGGTDSKIYSLHVKNHKTGVHVRNGITYLENCHAWLTNCSDDDLKGSIAFLIHGSSVIEDCYADTYETAIVNDNNQLMNIGIFHYYINKNWYNSTRTKTPPCYIKYIQSQNNIDNYPTGCSATLIGNLSFSSGLTELNDATFMNINENDWYKINKRWYWPDKLYATHGITPWVGRYEGNLTTNDKFNFIYLTCFRKNNEVIISGQVNWSNVTENSIVFSINDSMLRPSTRIYTGIVTTSGDVMTIQLNPNNGIFNATMNPKNSIGSTMFNLTYLIG